MAKTLRASQLHYNVATRTFTAKRSDLQVKDISSLLQHLTEGSDANSGGAIGIRVLIMNGQHAGAVAEFVVDETTICNGIVAMKLIISEHTTIEYKSLYGMKLIILDE